MKSLILALGCCMTFVVVAQETTVARKDGWQTLNYNSKAGVTYVRGMAPYENGIWSYWEKTEWSAEYAASNKGLTIFRVLLDCRRQMHTPAAIIEYDERGNYLGQREIDSRVAGWMSIVPGSSTDRIREGICEGKNVFL